MPHNLDIDHLPDSISSKDSTMSFSTEQKTKKKARKTKKKFAISAEAYGEYNKLGDFKPRNIPKSKE